MENDSDIELVEPGVSEAGGSSKRGARSQAGAETEVAESLGEVEEVEETVAAGGEQGEVAGEEARADEQEDDGEYEVEE